MKPEVRIKMEEYGERPVIQCNPLEHFTEEAKLAFSFIEKWGMVSSEEDGEDSAGRQKLRLATPEAVVTRAFEISRLAMHAARERQLTYSHPTLAELDEVQAAHKAEKEAKKKQPA